MVCGWSFHQGRATPYGERVEVFFLRGIMTPPDGGVVGIYHYATRQHHDHVKRSGVS